MALTLFGSQLAFSGVAILAKKAYEQAVVVSLGQLGGAIKERFQGNAKAR